MLGNILPPSHAFFFLVVEEPNVLFHKDDAELLGRLVDGEVVLTAAGRRDVLCAGAVGALDVVDEGELCKPTLILHHNFEIFGFLPK